MTSVYDPRSTKVDGLEMRLVVSDSSKIVVYEDEVEDLFNLYYERSKGANAKKLHGLICKLFAGISEVNIQTYVNSFRNTKTLHPRFLKKAPLIPSCHGC